MPLFSLPHPRPAWGACRHARHAAGSKAAGTPDHALAARKTPSFGFQARSSSAQPAELNEDEEVDVGERLSKAANIITTADQLVPFDTGMVNIALVIWMAIREVPEEHRPQLLSLLSPSAIRRLWQASGERYLARPSQVATALGPEYSIWRDLPERPEQLVHFAGKAALPAFTLALRRFGASFFLHPDTEQPYARLEVAGGPLLGDLLYPLYGRAEVGQALVPGTEELVDLVVHFQPPAQLGLSPDDIPRSAWPKPRAPGLPPLNRGFTAYLRAAGPGVYLGKGVRTLADGPEQPLLFVMAKRGGESLLD